MEFVASEITGTYFDGQSSAAKPCRLELGPDGRVRLWQAGDGVGAERILECTFDQLSIDSRLGMLPRHIRFPDGGMFTTEDHDTVDLWLQQFDVSPLRGLVFTLESKSRYVLSAILALVLSVWLFVQYGVPSASAWIAEKLPVSVVRKAGDQTLRLLDEHVFSATQLPDHRVAALQELFQQQFATEIDALHLRLNFRASERIGANAFALPSGDLVMTDDMVRLAGDDRELLAILAHEVGHIQQRHVLRRIVQDSFFLAVVALVTGDVSGSTSAIALVPLGLVELAYSRDFEREADNYALHFMRDHDIPTIHFANIMQRLQWQDDCGPAGDKQSSSGDNWNRLAKNLQYYMSTHPMVIDRVQQFGESTLPVDSRPDCGAVESKGTADSIER